MMQDETHEARDEMYDTAVFIGDHPLVVSCAGRLRAAGITVVGVSSTDATIEAWAASEGIEQVPWDDLPDFLAQRRPRVLLSVGNLRILPDDIVSAVDLAVNFHDGPLPDYAGLHVPMWAILAGEATHGVSWHVIEGGVDEGDVLASASFGIADDETTRSINLKCFAAASEAFDSLAGQLASGVLDRRPQHGTGRMCGRYDRPEPAGAVMASHMGAEAIERLVRALDFGPTLNRVGRPLVKLTDDTVMVASKAEIADGEAAPGVVREVHVDGESIRITIGTATTPIRLEGWAEAGTDPASLLGTTLPEVGAARGALAAAHESSVRNEVWWSRRCTPAPMTVPGTDPAAEPVDVVTAVTGDVAHVAALALAWSAAIADQPTVTVGVATRADRAIEPFFVTVVPAHATLGADTPVSAALDTARAAVDEALERGPYLIDTPLRMPAQVDGAPVAPRAPVEVLDGPRESGALVQFVVTGDGTRMRIRAPRLLAESLAAGFEAFVADAARRPETAIGAIDVVAEEEREALVELGGTPRALPFRGGLHLQFAARAAETPDATAVVHRGHSVTYGELDTRARRIAARLIDAGVRGGDRVGVASAPGIDTVAAVLGTLMVGAAYVPLDPRFPEERLTFMAADAGLALVLSDDPARLPVQGARTLDLHDLARRDGDAIGAGGASAIPVPVDADDLAYVMYTSGSTGRPKGVMVRHGNVDSFLQAMVPHLGSEDGVWLSVTTLSFDISVLELFHPLTHGWKIVLYEGLAAARPAAPGRGATTLDFSLFFFGSEGVEGGGEYQTLLEAARYGDERGFAAVWTPERHFNAFGGPFPNPAVTSAALAVATTNIALRSGSCVVPLHHPARIAEEWAVVDRLSGGRVGLSIAAGWHPDDFVFRPQNHGQPKSALIDQVDQVRALWRGESVTFPGPKGDVDVVTLPRPIQPELPVWYTTAGNIESFELAGTQGYNLLTHLLGQSVADIGAKIAAYRAAWDAAGHAGRGTVTLMLHTFVADDHDYVREIVREPMKGYLQDSISLVKDHASAFPTFDPNKTDADGLLMGLTPEDLDALLEVSFARYFETSGLFGTVDQAYEIAKAVHDVGVDEIAALIDFGIDGRTVLDHLGHLDEVRRRFLVEEAAPEILDTYGSLIVEHGVTHLQCTPSEARIVLADPDTRAALGRLDRMLVGGEACPTSVAADLLDAVGGEVWNVYGPTETTIWSTAHRITRADVEAGSLPVGRPLDNTTVRVVGSGGALRPRGAIGELLIGGAGVTAGYHGRAELTAERFVARDDTDGPVYRTGDLASWGADGILAFHGRADGQVKIRGHRIELGEIEAALESIADLAEAIVVVHGTGDAVALVGHLVGAGSARPDAAGMMAVLRKSLPSHMVPERYVWHDVLPTTPNGKVDRLALAAIAPGRHADAEAGAPVPSAPPTPVVPAPGTGAALSPAELAALVDVAWCETLGLEEVDRNRTFFDQGGNSLLVLSLREKLENKLGRSISLVDLFRYPTVNDMADAFAAADASAPSIPGGDEPSEVSGARPASDRAARRAAARQRGRRGRG